MAQGVHLDNRSHGCGIAIIKSVFATSQGRARTRFNGDNLGLLAICKVLMQERESETGKVRTATSTADDHIRIFPSHFHLLQRFLPNDSLMHEHMVEHGTEAVFLGTTRG